MNFFETESKIKSSSAIKLLKIDNAPLVISFLYQRFKIVDKITVLFTELSDSLNDYLEELVENGIEQYSLDASSYIKQWIDYGFLRNYYDEELDDFSVELMPDTEKVFQWLDELSTKEFVGTESRFLMIYNMLKEIVFESMEDPEEKIKELERQKQKIEKEIEQIKKEGVNNNFSSTQIKERYFLVKKESKELISDFRQVEHNFRDIARLIQKKHVVENLNKGEIVDYLLKSDDDLKESDQGRSFFSFWNFLRSPVQQFELQEVLRKIYEITDIATLETDDRFLKKIKKYLLASGEKVQKSTRKMAEQLRKVLDEQNLAENKRVIDLTKEIKKWAIENPDNYPLEKDFVLLEGDASINFVMERPLWQAKVSTVFNAIQLETENDKIDEDELKDLLLHSQVDVEEIKKKVQRLLRYQKQAGLPEVLEKYPVRKELEEIICYVQLANDSNKHIIRDDIKEHVFYHKKVNDKLKKITVEVPQVIYQV